MENYKELKSKIQKALPRLMQIERGQIFKSSYDGEIIATQITKYSDNLYSIYGFDINYGLPRSNYYSVESRIGYHPNDLELVGYEPQLNDVLEWLKGFDTDIQSINKYGIFHDKNWYGLQIKIYWDLSKPYLKDQSEKLINYLNSLTN